MKKRKIIAGLLIASAALGLASCGDKNPVDPNNPDTPEVLQFTVKFDSQGGSSVSSITIDANGKITLPANPTKEGYTFEGWYLDAAGTKTFASSTAITANITLYAKWTANAVEDVTYEVTFDGAEVAVQDIKAGEKVTKPTDPTKEGFIFGGWYKDADFTTAWDFETDTVTTDVKLYAKWTKNSEVNQTNAIEMNGVAYDTITAALAAIPKSGDTSTYTIRLNKGTYAENGLSYNGSATIHIIGNTNAKYGADVIIKGRGNNMSSMRGRELLEIQGTGNIILENVSLVSDYSRSESTKDAQAEVLGTDTKGNTVAYNCSFISHQDTLRTAGKAWFYGCYVEGDTDFIWMEAAGSVALYENCEIVSVWDEHAGTHTSYIAAPRMGVSSKVGKGLVFLNSVVKESEEAKEKGQKTYLARTPWSSGYYNQVSYINTALSDIELTDGPWYKNQIETEHPKTIIGWKMDSVSAASLNLSDKDYILDDATTAKEFNGRKAILNRIYNTGKQKYEKDGANNWDIDSLITANGWSVTKDTSSDVLEGEVASESTVYKFDGSTDLSSICNGFVQDNAKAHYVGQNGNTITIPVNGKCFVEVYGYYAGTAEIQADTQGYSVAFFTNGSTSTEIEQDYIVYDANAKEVVITAKATTYITKIVVTPDPNIAEANPVTSIEINKSTPIETVGVAVTLTASVNKDATNKSVVWSSSDTEVADIDTYTGRITFKKEGKVTFTATACDGSGITKTIECNPTEANWTACEWYTKDNNILEEEGADGISNFSVNDSAYKSLGATYTFTNLAGEEISTSNGFKLNSAGKLSIAITKPAKLTIITCDAGKVFVTPVVSNGTVTVTPVSTTQSTDGKVYTYVYEITDIGMWDIVRGENSQENNPILYAKCEYVEPVISTSTGITFKGSTYTESNTNISDIITPSEVIEVGSTAVYFDEFKLTNCKSNGSATNWLVFKNNATIEFKVDRACTVLVAYYSKLQTVKLNGVEVAGNKESVSSGAGEIVEYEITEAGTVVIEATQSDYLGFVGVVFKTLEMKKESAIAQLETAYPASKYTQNADYETVLAAQKAAINAAADDAALTAALAAAIVAMDALEADPVEEVYDFTNDITVDLTASTEAIEGTTGSWKGLSIDATAGKWANNNGGWIQVNTGTVISFTVAEGAQVSVVAYTSADNFTVAVEGTTCTITAVANDYLKILKVEYLYDFTKDITVDLTASTEKYEGSIGSWKGLSIDATAGKWANNNGGWIQVNTGTAISFTVAEGAQVSVVAYTSADNFTVAVEGTTCTITAIANDYLKTLNVVYPFDFTKDITVDLTASTEKYEGSVGSWKGLSIDATAGKWANNNGGWIQVNTGTTISFTVAEGAQVSVVAYTSADNFTVAVEGTTCTITAVANDYLKTLNVAYNFDFTKDITVDLTASTEKYEGSVGSWKGLSIDATAGKWANNNGGWIQVNTGTVISFTVAEGAQVSVVAYTSADNFTVAVEGTTCTITAIANDYLKTLTVTYTE